MEILDTWLIEAIRQEDDKGIMSGWLEEHRLNLVPLFRQALRHLFARGSFILLSDLKFEWLTRYIAQNINMPNKTRPFFPIFEVNSLGFMIDSVHRDTEDRGFLAISKMLEHSFCKNYALWYIGKKTARGEFAPAQENSFIWLLDEQMPHCFSLSSVDELLDYKLLQLYKLFEKTLCAAMLGQLTLEA